MSSWPRVTGVCLQPQLRSPGAVALKSVKTLLQVVVGHPNYLVVWAMRSRPAVMWIAGRVGPVGGPIFCPTALSTAGLCLELPGTEYLSIPTPFMVISSRGHSVGLALPVAPSYMIH